MKRAPGKSPFEPMPDCATASSAASTARRSDSIGATKGSTLMESIVPAIVVRSPSVGKRLMRLMPERPAVIAAQVSSLPCPREVTTPMPVTATSGRPCLSRSAMLFSSSPRETKRAFAPPMADRGDERFVGAAAGDEAAASAAPIGACASIVWPTRSPVARTVAPSPSSASRSSSVAPFKPVAPEITMSGFAPSVSAWRRTASATRPGSRRIRSETTPDRTASASTPRADACSRDSRTRKQAPEPRIMPPPCAGLSKTGTNGFFQRKPPIS